jgi:hypothetical protein
MESEGEEDVESSKAFIPCIEVAFGHGEGVSEVESAIHVGERESLEEFLLFTGLRSEKLIPVPDILSSLLERDEFVSSCCVLHLWIY